jgi:hypothetical protein
MTSKRQWTAFYDVDGALWAIFLDGHDHDLRTLRSLACKEEMRKASVGSNDCFHGNLDIGHWWIRDMAASAREPDHPWEFCDKDDRGAVAISGAKFQ